MSLFSLKANCILHSSILVIIMLCSHSDQLLRQLFNSISQPSNGVPDHCQDGDGDVMLDAAFDYDWLHEVGSGIDDCPLPNHLSSTAEILDLLERVKSLITRLPRPSAVTIARSYC